MSMANRVADAMGRRSSRRQFFKFLGASSLGTGLALTRSGISLGAVTACAGCGGGPCNPCFSPHVRCGQIGRTCRDGCNGGGCPSSCSTTGEWYCCNSSKCRVRCSECSCPNGCCHCFTPLKSTCPGGGPCPC